MPIRQLLFAIAPIVFGIVLFCAGLLVLPLATSAESMTEEQIRAQEALWREELAKTEEEIRAWEKVLGETKVGTASLTRDARILQAKISEARAFIRQRNTQIEILTHDINQKKKRINYLERKIDESKVSMASIIRTSYELENYSLIEAVLSNQNLSEFFQDVTNLGSIQLDLSVKVAEIRGLQIQTDQERKALDQKRVLEVDTKAKIEQEKKQVEINEREKQELIKINKTQEKTYSQVISEKQKRASAIRAALFALRDSEGIPFGDALRYAQNAEKKTGIRAALVLAILTQESDLGKNQGSCLVNDLETGDGSGKNTGNRFERVMKAPRDTIPFEAIATRLGKEWKMTPVSCPPGAVWTASRGYGGGMGPSQFIPSTWELFKERLGGYLGIGGESVNPWNPEHAILATSVYMADLGAAGGGYTAERNAACRYYSGASCNPSRRPSNVFYGDQVLSKATRIQQEMINPLEGF